MTIYSDIFGKDCAHDTNALPLPIRGATDDEGLRTPDWGHTAATSEQTNTVKQIRGKPRGWLRALVLRAMQSLVPNGVVNSGAKGYFLQKGVEYPTS